MSEVWASPQEEASVRDSNDGKKFDFGPRVFRPKHKKDESPGNIFVKLPQSDLNVKAPQVADITPTSKSVQSIKLRDDFPNKENSHQTNYLDLQARLILSDNRLHALESERDEWKQRAETAMAQSEGSLGDMLVEIELESLREEVARLRSLTASNQKEIDAEQELATLRLRCVELEAQVSNLKKDKLASEHKNAAARNAEMARVRELQELVTSERRMRERMVASESALPVVSVAPAQRPGDSTPSSSGMVVIRPRSGSIVSNHAVPAFQAGSVPSKKPDVHLEKTMVLPVTSSTLGGDGLGNDVIAESWRSVLAEKPLRWKSILTRQAGTNIFNFGSQKVACKKIGNLTMIQVGRETMILEKFIDQYGPKEVSDFVPTGSTSPKAKPVAVTMKSILANKQK